MKQSFTTAVTSAEPYGSHCHHQSQPHTGLADVKKRTKANIAETCKPGERATTIMARKPGMVISSFNYFNGVMRDFAGSKAAPKLEPHQPKVRAGTHKSKPEVETTSIFAELEAEGRI